MIDITLLADNVIKDIKEERSSSCETSLARVFAPSFWALSDSGFWVWGCWVWDLQFLACFEMNIVLEWKWHNSLKLTAKQHTVSKGNPVAVSDLTWTGFGLPVVLLSMQEKPHQATSEVRSCCGLDVLPQIRGWPCLVPAAKALTPVFIFLLETVRIWWHLSLIFFLEHLEYLGVNLPLQNQWRGFDCNPMIPNALRPILMHCGAMSFWRT